MFRSSLQQPTPAKSPPRAAPKRGREPLDLSRRAERLVKSVYWLTAVDLVLRARLREAPITDPTDPTPG
jgi:hypothetical protein